MQEYKVVGPREYRGHATGVVFHANIPASVATRAIKRGDIVFIREVTPGLQPGWELPAGWVTDNERTERSR